MKLFLTTLLLLSLASTSFASDQNQIIQEAAKIGIAADVVAKVAKKESGFRCRPNNPRYHGPLQISLSSARALGYSSSDGPLNSCGAGLKYGLRHLKLCVNKVGNNPSKAAHCHSMPGKYGVRLVWR